MGVVNDDLKKVIRFILVFALIALSIYGSILYMGRSYNLKTTEITFTGSINYDEYVRDRKIPDITSVKYMKHESGREIIAIGSGYERFERIELLNGSLKSSLDNYAILGERIARELYSGNYIIGEKFNYQDKEYTVIGVEKGSSNIYLSYSYDIENINWDKKMILYSGGLDSNLGNNLVYSLSSDGNELLKIVQREKKILLFSNIIRLIIIICCIRFIIGFVFPYIRRLISNIINNSLSNGSFSTGKIMDKFSKKSFVGVILVLISSVISIYVIILSVRGITPIESIYVSDILSPSSYVDMISRNIERVRTDLGWGLSAYERTYFLITLGLIFLSFAYKKIIAIITSLIEA